MIEKIILLFSWFIEIPFFCNVLSIFYFAQHRMPVTHFSKSNYGVVQQETPITNHSFIGEHEFSHIFHI